jgi:hypothetical protein
MYFCVIREKEREGEAVIKDIIGPTSVFEKSKD